MAVLGEGVLARMKGVVGSLGPIEPAPGRSSVRQRFHSAFDTGAGMALLELFRALPVLVSELVIKPAQLILSFLDVLDHLLDDLIPL